jgi:hypothetical protein
LSESLGIATEFYGAMIMDMYRRRHVEKELKLFLKGPTMHSGTKVEKDEIDR